MPGLSPIALGEPTDEALPVLTATVRARAVLPCGDQRASAGGGAKSRYAPLIAGAILTSTALFGDWLLRQLGISLPAFRIARGLLLFSIASEMAPQQSGAK
jgi:hypothetical protein